MGILGLDHNERFTIAKSNWDYEGRADGRRIDWGETSYYRGTIYMQTESRAGTIGNVLHYSTTKRYVVRDFGQGEYTTTRASVTFGSDRIRTYRGRDEKSSPADSYRLSSPERVPEETRSRVEET